MGNASTLAGMLLMFGVVAAAPAPAQTSPEGAFQRLSPGNQKIARALFDAQQFNNTTLAAPAANPGTTKPMTLDQIAAQKLSGQGWAQVFKNMKAQGLLEDKSLGQVVSRYQQDKKYSGGVVTATSNRATPKLNAPAAKGKGDSDGNGHPNAARSSAPAGSKK